jgi:hypothetical protein
VGNAPGPVKFYKELSAAALKTKLDKEVTVWYELRASNVTTGCGKLNLCDAVPDLIRHFGYSEATIYRILRSGDGIFWDLYQPSGAPGRSLIVRGSYRVAAWFNSMAELAAQLKQDGASIPEIASKLGVSVATANRLAPTDKLAKRKGQAGFPDVEKPVLRIPFLSRPRTVELEGLPKGRAGKRAALYCAFFKPQGVIANPISRESIKAATGLGRRQQRRYERQAGIKRVANFGCVEVEGRLVPLLLPVESKRKKSFKQKRINIYHSPGKLCPRGMCKRVNDLLKGSCSGEAPLRSKRWFRTGKSLLKTPVTHRKPSTTSPVRHKEPFVLVSPWQRLVPGRMEWCLA